MVGKTSLIRRFVLDEFSPEYKATLGVGIYKHQVETADAGDSKAVDLVLWDIEGGEHRQKMLPTYMMGASGAVLVCDATRPDTVDVLDNYAEVFEARSPGRPFLMAANKMDLIEDGQVPDRIQAKAKTLNAPLIATSARTGDRVTEAFQALSSHIYDAGF